MLKFVVLTFVTLAIAVGGGAASVWYALEASRDLGAVDVGRWTATPDFGTPQSNPYSMARFAREGGLSLGQAEGITFTAERDSSGAGLTASCNYAVQGPVPAARFWTVYATDPSGRPLPPVGRRAPALQSRALLHSLETPVDVAVGPDPAPGNWLAVPRKGPMRLVLTLFDTPVSGETDILDIDLPTITRSSCDG